MQKKEQTNQKKLGEDPNYLPKAYNKLDYILNEFHNEMRID